jgi:hypothetical protein
MIKETITNVIKIGIGILFLAGMFSMAIVLRDCSKADCPGKGNVIISKAVWDSIQKIADLPPKIHIDTVKIKGDVVYVHSPIPKPEPGPDSAKIKIYKDSLVNKDINVWATLKVKGDLIDREWKYTPIKTEVIKEITTYVPKIVNNEVKVPQRGLYINGSVGGNANAFIFGAGADLITKKNTEFGYFYQRYGSVNFHSIKMGIKL